MILKHRTSIGEVKDHILFENNYIKLSIDGWKPNDYKRNKYMEGIITLEIKGLKTIIIKPEWDFDYWNVIFEEKSDA